jgi:hypothetical protein
MLSIGKLLVVFGVVMVVAGLALMFSDKIPLLGKLPGDIHIKKEHTEFYFPIVSSLVVSLFLNGVLWLISILDKK